MNKLSGHISTVKVSGNLSLVTISLSDGLVFRAIIIETPETAPYLIPGNPIHAIFKETEVVLARGDDLQLSLPNRIQGTISKIRKGELLSEVVLSTEVGEITAIVGSDILGTLGLKKDTVVTAMVKLNEVMLAL